MLKLIYLLVIVIMVSGCAVGEANRYYLKDRFPAKDIKEVEVLKDKPSRPFDVMADLQASNVTYKYMQTRAAEIGADAVIVTCTGGWYSRSEVWADKDKYSNSCTGLIGTAIKYKSE